VRGVVGIAQYLVIKALAGRGEVIEALYGYFVEGKSPSALAAEHGLSKHQVRGYIQRILEKASFRRARAAIALLYPFVMRIEPIIARDGRLLSCRLCGAELINEYAAEDHIRFDHFDLVSELVVEIAEMALAGLRA